MRRRERLLALSLRCEFCLSAVPRESSGQTRVVHPLIAVCLAQRPVLTGK